MRRRGGGGEKKKKLSQPSVVTAEDLKTRRQLKRDNVSDARFLCGQTGPGNTVWVISEKDCCPYYLFAFYIESIGKKELTLSHNETVTSAPGAAL